LRKVAEGFFGAIATRYLSRIRYRLLHVQECSILLMAVGQNLRVLLRLMPSKTWRVSSHFSKCSSSWNRAGGKVWAPADLFDKPPNPKSPKNLNNKGVLMMLQLNCRINRSFIRADRKNVVFLGAEVIPLGSAVPTRTPDLDVCLAIDCSSSMEGEKIEIAKEAAVRIVEQLRPSDFISVVRFATTSDVVVPRQPATEKDQIIDRITRLQLGTMTALFDGLALAFKQLAYKTGGRVGRIIAITDGQPTEGPTDTQSFVELAKNVRESNISITGLGIGEDYNEDLLIAMAMNSDGRWYHVTDPSQIFGIFQEELQDMKTVVAVKPELRVSLLSGCELLNVYRAGTMVTELTNYKREDSDFILPVEDIRAGSSCRLALRIAVPPLQPGKWKIARLRLTSPGVQQESEVEIESTDDFSKWGRETDPTPRAWISLAEATVLAREGIENPTLIKKAEDMVQTLIKDADVATVARKDPYLMAMGNTVIRVAQTVARGSLSEDEKKRLKQETSVIRR
ncbi:MAG: VWA domain-containing protein, partial [Candidatus Hadarchaeales archaeon]